jgi:hypothetical protein
MVLWELREGKILMYAFYPRPCQRIGPEAVFGLMDEYRVLGR